MPSLTLIPPYLDHASGFSVAINLFHIEHECNFFNDCSLSVRRRVETVATPFWKNVVGTRNVSVNNFVCVTFCYCFLQVF